MRFLIPLAAMVAILFLAGLTGCSDNASKMLVLTVTSETDTYLGGNTISYDIVNNQTETARAVRIWLAIQDGDDIFTVAPMGWCSGSYPIAFATAPDEENIYLERDYGPSSPINGLTSDEGFLVGDILPGHSVLVIINYTRPPAVPGTPVLTVGKTDYPDPEQGTPVDIIVFNPTDQVIKGVILAVEQSGVNVRVTLWYGFEDKLLTQTIWVKGGQQYTPGRTTRQDNWGEPINIGNTIVGEDGYIIGDIAPHATVAVTCWFTLQ